ncbi:MAG: hypothetical protein M5T61_15435 [Acidimicrobiia bacterium]|nr:hypothetical protein [Acidimicrobiia bacterium]
MGVLGTPIASFSKSELRRPEVTERASVGPVEIRASGSTAALLLVPESAVEALRELQHAAEEFVRMVVELRRPNPSPVVLGPVGFIAAWPKEQQDRFLEGYAEALVASLRSEDSAPLRSYVATMAAPGRRSDRPDFDGRVPATTQRDLATRLSS